MAFQELDIAIVKATNHVERPSNERYIRGGYHRWLVVPCFDIFDGFLSTQKAFNKLHPYYAAIFMAISATRPRADVAYCIHALARRLSRTHNWAVLFLLLIRNLNTTAIARCVAIFCSSSWVLLVC